jgi:hypothetical protein
MLQYMYSNKTAITLLKLFILTNILGNFINGFIFEIQSWLKKQGENNFPFSSVSRLVLRPIQPHIQREPLALSLSIKQLGHAADYPPPSSTKVENVWRYTSQWSDAYESQHRDFACVWSVLLWTDRRLSSCSATIENWTLSSHSFSEISLHQNMHWHLSYHRTHVQ